MFDQRENWEESLTTAKSKFALEEKLSPLSESEYEQIQSGRFLVILMDSEDNGGFIEGNSFEEEKVYDLEELEREVQRQQHTESDSSDSEEADIRAMVRQLLHKEK